MAMQEFKIEASYAYRLVSQTIELFGDSHRTNKDMYRHLVSERLTVIMRESREDKNYDQELRAIELLARVQGLNAIKGEDANILIPVLPSTVVFTTNPNALNEAEEAEYEEQE
jgi:hypothetical protein